LGSVALVALDAESYRCAQESLEQFIAVGGFSMASADNPRQNPLDAGRITTPEQQIHLSYTAVQCRRSGAPFG
jgi:hypothetical protein